jgi:hypothetical protein
MGNAHANGTAVGRAALTVSAGTRLRELIAAPGMLLMPGAYDALSLHRARCSANPTSAR